jgi:hypothetical protein
MRPGSVDVCFVERGGVMADDDACSLCGREGSSMHVIVLDTGEHTLICPDCERASGDELLLPGIDDQEVVL